MTPRSSTSLPPPRSPPRADEPSSSARHRVEPEPEPEGRRSGGALRRVRAQGVPRSEVGPAPHPRPGTTTGTLRRVIGRHPPAGAGGSVPALPPTEQVGRARIPRPSGTARVSAPVRLALWEAFATRTRRPSPWTRRSTPHPGRSRVIDLVAGRHVGPGGWLSPREEAWLGQVDAAPDRERSRSALTSWRIERLSRATPLTLLMLRQLGCEHRVVEAYVVATAAPSSQLIPEGLQFLAFVERVATREPHLFELLDLERQALLARAVPWTAPPAVRRATGWLDRGSLGAAIEVGAEPEELLVAVVTGRPLPRPGSGSGTLLVGPGRRREVPRGRPRRASGAARGPGSPALRGGGHDAQRPPRPSSASWPPGSWSTAPRRCHRGPPSRIVVRRRPPAMVARRERRRVAGRSP